MLDYWNQKLHWNLGQWADKLEILMSNNQDNHQPKIMMGMHQLLKVLRNLKNHNHQLFLSHQTEISLLTNTRLLVITDTNTQITMDILIVIRDINITIIPTITEAPM